MHVYVYIYIYIYYTYIYIVQFNAYTDLCQLKECFYEPWSSYMAFGLGSLAHAWDIIGSLRRGLANAHRSGQQEGLTGLVPCRVHSSLQGGGDGGNPWKSCNNSGATCWSNTNISQCWASNKTSRCRSIALVSEWEFPYWMTIISNILSSRIPYNHQPTGVDRSHCSDSENPAVNKHLPDPKFTKFLSGNMVYRKLEYTVSGYTVSCWLVVWTSRKILVNWDDYSQYMGK